MLLRCLQTRTGVKFVITAERGTVTPKEFDAVIKEIYLMYVDCVLKDPFYELEMPVRSELFTSAVDTLMERMEKSGGGIGRR